MEPMSLPLSPNLSPTSSPYITAPSSPKHPADDPSDGIDRPDFEIQLKSFDGEYNRNDDEEDITFEFSVDHFQSFSLPAEELFDGGKIRTLNPPPANQPDHRVDFPPPENRNASQTKRKIIWSSRRSYDFSEAYREQSGIKTVSFGGSKATRLNRLINILTFRRPSSSERGSTTSTGFGSTGSSSSGSGSGSFSSWGGRYLSGSVREPDKEYAADRDEVKSCLPPCKQRFLSCFVKKL